MKKSLLAWALMLALLLCSCTQTGPSAETAVPAPSDDVTAGDVAAAIVDSQEDRADYAPLGEEDRDFYVNQLYGVDEGIVSEAAVYTAGGVDAREIAVLHLFEDKDADAALQALLDYQKSRQGDFFGYAPDQADLVERGRAGAAGRYVALLLCTAPDGAAKAFAEYLDRPLAEPASMETQTVSTPVSAPSSVLEATAEPSAAFEIRDPDAVVPFDPPREFDMSLYDDASIVRAWETGDESGLDEKQTAILAKCREIFAECITDGMTDFQKELALHDWLTTHGEYDKTHYDPRAPLGREDNTNPYGMLVKGYGICLGYAETFRLLMDLAGVECITVPGAAFHSREDHAWNMVKLEGEWYCVDPTWDNSPSHHYFNVTSEYLRKTDHQWDYENVPEATATRFCWDGTGPLPS